jgi:translation elongation factor EF-4
LKFQEDEILEISAKNGINIEKVFDSVLKKVRPPSGRKDTLSR